MFLLDEPVDDLDPAASHAIPRPPRDTAEAEVARTFDHAAECGRRIFGGRPVARALDGAAVLFGIAGVGPRSSPLQ
jgi:hypothetical protein